MSPATAAAAPLRIYVIGVCGCGKSVIGGGLAEALALPFIEGDDYHPPANVEKMRGGTPLDDADRWPWLRALADAGAREAGAAARRAAVIACSGLKRAYRERLAAGDDVRSVFALLHGERELLARRLAARGGHFMPAALLDSQLATLEMPVADEPWPVITADIAEPPAAVVETLRERLLPLLPV